VICLTFDTDHVRAEDLERFCSELRLPGRGTFFLWDRFPNMVSYPHEFEPHPAFSGTTGWRSQLETFTRALGMEGKGCRPHSLAYSHELGVVLAQLGYRYVSQADPVFQDGLTPYRHPWGIWEMPIYYMDNMDFCMALNWGEGHRPFSRDVIRRSLESEALFVYDFHPLHVLLNTPDFETYQQDKPRILGGESPYGLRHAGRGAGIFFEELCRAMEDAGLSSLTCLDALGMYDAPRGKDGVVRPLSS
jgi:hypothetical protein